MFLTRLAKRECESCNLGGAAHAQVVGDIRPVREIGQRDALSKQHTDRLTKAHRLVDLGDHCCHGPRWTIVTHSRIEPRQLGVGRKHEQTLDAGGREFEQPLGVGGTTPAEAGGVEEQKLGVTRPGHQLGDALSVPDRYERNLEQTGDCPQHVCATESCSIRTRKYKRPRPVLKHMADRQFTERGGLSCTCGANGRDHTSPCDNITCLRDGARECGCKRLRHEFLGRIRVYCRDEETHHIVGKRRPGELAPGETFDTGAPGVALATKFAELTLHESAKLAKFTANRDQLVAGRYSHGRLGTGK